ncbi:MAG: hypothetical protein BWY59_01392 [Verrucomicrobia bacterium ADurb.Bin345]|nr:MAG: hypothetical protein BWY59_01392 [Verrucomicrobia bacterium ADurb.Bin345]
MADASGWFVHESSGASRGADCTAYVRPVTLLQRMMNPTEVRDSSVTLKTELESFGSVPAGYSSQAQAESPSVSVSSTASQSLLSG